ncbi:protein DJ 1 [Trichuris trichiura]|uniref:D-lactate dehydratase n=1 Tax=Trichuris trichiura TaxID=36087 RepID=A0A077ZA72_TRITR|nr:protein DJ 1 [Trichuris trichiura]
MASKKVLVILADGSEEMEVIIAVDVLRRGGLNVVLAGLGGERPHECSRGVKVVPDKSFDVVKGDKFDAVVLPGGMGGATLFCKSENVGKLLKKQEEEGRLIAAICAGPLALTTHKIATGRSVTCHPSVKEQMEQTGSHKYSNGRVVHDGLVVTSQGPGTAFEFALKLVEILVSKEKADEITKPLLCKL